MCARPLAYFIVESTKNILIKFVIVDFIWVWSSLFRITKFGVMFAHISKLVHCLGNVVMTYRRYYRLKHLLVRFLF